MIALVNCSFIKSQQSELRIGLMPMCDSAELIVYGFQDDVWRTLGMAFGLTASVVGSLSTIAVWLMTCKSCSRKCIAIGLLCMATLVAFMSQLLTLTMFYTEYCRSDGKCKLEWGGIVSVTAAAVWFISYIEMLIYMALHSSMPHGKMMLFPAFVLSVATVLSFVALLSCSFVEIGSFPFQMGLLPVCEPTVMSFSGFEDDRLHYVYLALGSVACIVGTGATIAAWLMTCKLYSYICIGILYIAIAFSCLIQSSTLTVFFTEDCKTNSCSLAWGGIVSIAAAGLWLFGLVSLCCVTLTPKSSDSIVDMPTKDARSVHESNNDLEEENLAENETSANLEGSDLESNDDDEPSTILEAEIQRLESADGYDETAEFIG